MEDMRWKRGKTDREWEDKKNAYRTRDDRYTTRFFSRPPFSRRAIEAENARNHERQASRISGTEVRRAILTLWFFSYLCIAVASPSSAHGAFN